VAVGICTACGLGRRELVLGAGGLADGVEQHFGRGIRRMPEWENSLVISLGHVGFGCERVGCARCDDPGRTAVKSSCILKFWPRASKFRFTAGCWTHVGDRIESPWPEEVCPDYVRRVVAKYGLSSMRATGPRTIGVLPLPIGHIAAEELGAYLARRLPYAALALPTVRLMVSRGSFRILCGQPLNKAEKP